MAPIPLHLTQQYHSIVKNDLILDSLIVVVIIGTAVLKRRFGNSSNPEPRGRGNPSSPPKSDA